MRQPHPGSAEHPVGPSQQLKTLKQLTVKFVSKGPKSQDHKVWLRQFPLQSGIWGNCRFVFDPDAERYDWLVVYDDLPRSSEERFSNRTEKLSCRRDNTLLITTEPSSVKHYSKPFLSQFGHVLSSQEPRFIDHPNAIFSQTGLHWFYGIGKHGKGQQTVVTYDELKAAKVPEKPRLISTVCSSKKQKKSLHNTRYQFTEALKPSLPDFAHYGHGIEVIADKADALDPFKYHIAIENHACKHHWTEKLSDPFLGFCLPFYFGCPNLDDYFPQDSYVYIDLFDLEKSKEVILTAINNNYFEKRLSAISEARRLILDEYNLFALISKIIEDKHVPSTNPPSNETILSRRACKMKHPVASLLSSLKQR